MILTRCRMLAGCWSCLSLMAVWGAPIASAQMVRDAIPQNPEADVSGEEGVAAIVETINQAWRTPEGAGMIAGVLADESYAYIIRRPSNRDEVMILDKSRFVQSFDREVRRPGRPEYAFESWSVHADGPLAYQLGANVTTTSSGERIEAPFFNIYGRTSEGWRQIAVVRLEGVRQAFKDDEHAKRDVRRIAMRLFNENAWGDESDESLAGSSTTPAVYVAPRVAMIDGDGSLREDRAEIITWLRAQAAKHRVRVDQVLAHGAACTVRAALTDPSAAGVTRAYATLMFERLSDAWLLSHVQVTNMRIPLTPGDDD